METNDGGSQLLAALVGSICYDPDIEFVIAFGSSVTDDSHRSSDLDLAIKFDDDLTAHERFHKWCFLSGDLQRSDAPFVDLSDIGTLPVDIANDAVNGQFLCGDEAAFRAFKADVEEAFKAQCDDIRRHQRDVIERIAEEGLSG